MIKPIKILIAACLFVVVAFMLILLAAGFVEASLWIAQILGLQHTLGMDTQTTHNYDAVSGVLPMIVAALGFSSLITGWWKHINCEVQGCLRPGHIHPGHGRPICRKHYHCDVVPEFSGEA